MFVDIVGYSRIAEMTDPHECFADLQHILASISNTVVEFGGKVDKVMGDGMLCYFGHNEDESRPSRVNHATAAITCALTIQRDNLDAALQAQLKGRPIFPLRIGINTDQVMVGTLEDGERGQLTIIGHGVNLARRLESASDGFSIMLGTQTMELLKNIDYLDTTPRKRLIQIKHHQELIEAYECNPFEKEQELLSKGIEAYRNYLQISRKDRRWPVPSGSPVRIISAVGDGELVDFSTNGFGVRLPAFLGKGVQISMGIEFPDTQFNSLLEKERLSNVVAEVRWARPSSGGSFLHGTQFLAQNQAMGERLAAIIKSFLTREPR
jgi:class 3 adenylate cyclase